MQLWLRLQSRHESGLILVQNALMRRRSRKKSELQRCLAYFGKYNNFDYKTCLKLLIGTAFEQEHWRAYATELYGKNVREDDADQSGVDATVEIDEETSRLIMEIAED